MTEDFTQKDVWWDEHGNLLTKGKGGDAYVMVQFEKPMMEKSAAIICRGGGNILNVGFGCGLVDDAIQRHEPATHTIIEPHPQIYQHMVELGWEDKPGVTIHNCTWQEVDWSRYRGHFDGVFWDPFPFEETEPQWALDRFAWYRLVTRIVRPDTGVFIIYMVTTNPRAGEVFLKKFPGIELRWEAEPCDVDVPFEVPEWRSLGPGKHRIYLPYFRVPAATDGG